MANKKNLFDEPGTAGKKPQRRRTALEFWEDLIGKWKDSDAQAERKLPKNPDQRLKMLREEIANIGNIIKTNRKYFTPQEYEALTVLQEALGNRIENQPSFSNCDCMKIDQRLFELCRIADESIERGYYTAALWSMRGLSSGLIDVRQDIAFAEQVSITGNFEKAEANELENRERHLQKYVDIACEYSWIDKSGKELEKRRKSLDVKNKAYKEAYEKLETVLGTEEGKVGLKLLKENPATTDKNAREVDELIRTQAKNWIACEVEESLILDLKVALEALENGVNTLRANLNNSASLKNFLREFRVKLDNALKEARENREQLYQSIGAVQNILEDDRQRREAFERSDRFRDVVNNPLRQLELQKEKEAEDQSLKNAIEQEVSEEQRILEDERKIRAEKERLEAERLDAEAEKAEKERLEAENLEKSAKMIRVRIQEP